MTTKRCALAAVFLLLWASSCVSGRNARTPKLGANGLPRIEGSWDDFQGSKRPILRTFEARCKQGKPLACFVLGSFYEKGVGTLKNTWNAYFLYQKACAQKHFVSCFNLGVLERDGVGEVPNPTLAALYFRYACKQGEGRSCAALAELMQQGKGVTKDPKQAHQLLKRGCQYKIARACNNLAYAYRHGLGVAADEAAFQRYLKQACQMGYRSSCLRLAWAKYSVCKAPATPQCLSDAEKQRRTVARIKRACTKTNAPLACAAWGKHVEVGRFDFGKAGQPLRWKPENAKKAFSFYMIACQQGDPWGCNEVANLYRRGKGGIARDIAQTESLYDYACRKGFALACLDLAILRIYTKADPSTYINATCRYNATLCLKAKVTQLMAAIQRKVQASKPKKNRP